MSGESANNPQGLSRWEFIYINPDPIEYLGGNQIQKVSVYGERGGGNNYFNITA
jgi:hypothetical protein